MMPAPRRALLAGGLGLAGVLRGHPAGSQPRDLPSLTVLVATDGIPGGDQTLRAFAQSHAHLLREALFLQEDTSWIGGGLTDEVRAGQASADVVVTNTAGFQAGSANQIWQALPADTLALAEAGLTPAGLLLRPITGQTGLPLAAAPGGPVLLHNASVLPAPPRSAAALLDFARQNPGRVQYARPRESLYGQTFVTALPYLLGDRDPADPQTGWNLAWDYLAELGQHVGYHPSSGAAALAEFAEGGCDLAPCLLPNFLLARSLGLLPDGTDCAPFAPGVLIADGMIMAVPRGLPEARLPLVAALARFLLTPRIQAVTFGRGLLPGFPQAEPVAAGLLTASESALWTQALSARLRDSMAGPPVAPPLGPFQLGYMLRRWEDAIGAHHGRDR